MVSLHDMGIFDRSTSISDSGLFRGYTDSHCHILPGVDDGVRTVDESLDILDRYAAAGISSVWLTPHIMEDLPNTTSYIRQAFTSLQIAYMGTIALHLASENMLDDLFEERLASRDLLPLDGRRLLVETSYFNPPADLDGLLERIRVSGYIPVLAHPERYMYMDSKDYRKLKTRGVLFQLNIPSICGEYGPEVQSRAMRLLSDGMYDVSGTDLRRASSFDSLLATKLKNQIIRHISEIR